MSKRDCTITGIVTRNCMVRVVPLRAETRVRLDAYAIAQRNRANSTPCGARSVKRLPTLHRQWKACPPAHCSSRVAWFRWTELSAEVNQLRDSVP